MWSELLKAQDNSGDRCCEGSAIRLQGLVAKERAEVEKRQGRDQEAIVLHKTARQHLEDALPIFEDIGDCYMQANTHGAREPFQGSGHARPGGSGNASGARDCPPSRQRGGNPFDPMPEIESTIVRKSEPP